MKQLIDKLERRVKRLEERETARDAAVDSHTRELAELRGSVSRIENDLRRVATGQTAMDMDVQRVKSIVLAIQVEAHVNTRKLDAILTALHAAVPPPTPRPPEPLGEHRKPRKKAS